jgi:hypothetical protein
MKHQINLPRNLGRVLDQYVEARTTSVALQGWIPSRTVDLTGTAATRGRAKWARLRFASGSNQTLRTLGMRRYAIP